MTTTVTVKSVQTANGVEPIPLSLLVHLQGSTHAEVPETIVSIHHFIRHLSTDKQSK